jgi:hypothetical protein
VAAVGRGQREPGRGFHRRGRWLGVRACRFVDLYRFLRWNSDPGRRTDSEAELVGRVGEWIGSTVLGGAVAAAMVATAPVRVRVVLPPVLG